MKSLLKTIDKNDTSAELIFLSNITPNDYFLWEKNETQWLWQHFTICIGIITKNRKTNNGSANISRYVYQKHRKRNVFHTFYSSGCKAKQCNTKRSNAKQSKAMQSKAMQSNATHRNAKQSNAEQSKAKQFKAKQCKAKQCKAKQSNAKQSNAKQSNAKQSEAMQSKAK